MATTSTVVTADVTITPADGDVQSVLFEGNVQLTGDRTGMKMADCVFRGKQSNTSNNIVRANHATQVGNLFEHCLFDNWWFPSDNAANGGHGGVQGHDMSLYRCELKSSTDGIGIVAPGNVTIEGCDIHGLWFFSPDSNHLTDGTHCDGIQGHGGTIDNVTIEGCSIQGLLNDSLTNSQASIDPVFDGSDLIGGHSWKDDYFSLWNGIYSYPPWGTSAILFGGSAVNGLHIIDNWLDGGGYAAINLNNNINNSSSSDVVITGNRVGGNVRDKTGGRGYLLICSSSLTTDLTLSGNVNENDSTANNSRRNG